MELLSPDVPRPNGERLGVDPVRHEDLHQQWPEISHRCGLPPCELTKRANEAAPGHLRRWPADVDLVPGMARHDIDRFGFEVPECIE